MAISAPKGKNRYQSLIMFISIFVLIIVSMLLANFYFSSQFSKDATKINLAGRQRMLSQKQAKIVGKLIQAQSANERINSTFKEVKSTFVLFDKTLNAFTNGGETDNTNGEKVALESIKKGDAFDALTEGNKIWSNYRIAMSKLVNSDISSLYSLADAAAYAKKNDGQLLSLMDRLTKSLIKNKASNVDVDLSGRQRMLSQRITKSLFELINSQNSLEDKSTLITSLKNDVQAFNSALSFLNKGTTNKESLLFLKKGMEIWKPLSTKISGLLSADTEIFSVISKANAYANNDNLALLKTMNDLTVALEKEQSNRSDLLGYIQIAGIILALGMFGFIMMFFMRHLKKADAQLDQAVEETEEILTTIKDGLFLIDQEHIIGKQHSKSLSSVINIDEPAGQDFLKILGNIVPDKTIQVAKEYLDLLYSDKVHPDLVGDLNPLDQVEVYFEGEDFEKNLGYLAFDFKRVTKEGGIPHLLVQVEDISKKVILERQLEETKGAAQEQFDTMLQVLHVQPKVLVQFLQDTEESLNKINATLQKNSSELTENTSNEEKIESIARYMHRIKGDASGLQLHGFEQKAHEFEDLFGQLKNKSNLAGKDFLPVVIKLEEFLKQLGSLRSMIDKLADLKETLNAEEGTELQIDNANGTKMSTILNILVNSVSSRQNKNVILNIFNEHLLPDNYIKPIHDILTQLIRNSVVHGIEDSETRQKLNKTDEGVIAVKFFVDSEKNMLTMKYLDNGKGLCKADIIKSAIEKGLINEKEALSMSEEEIFLLIFKSGFSTKQEVETDAGRGVGMDVIHFLVEKHSGNISIDSIENQVFKVNIDLPIGSLTNDDKRSEMLVLEEA